ncbi:MAG: helix-turn-helix transcriptional regulator [Gammaproteobacteria bacterium]|nr:helix-turn-helix transcriptional regulator [Gammaproteobacteria bacterium]
MNLDVLLAMQNEDFRKSFGARLKDLRKQKRWSQKELAAKVNIRFQQLNKYESGLNLPPAEMLIKLADALTTTVDYLLTGNPAEEMPLGNARLFRRFQAVESFDSEDREAVIRLIDGMIAKQQMQTTLTSLNDQAVNA